MENEKLSVNFAPGQTVAELIIREGQAPQPINPKPPVKTDITGTLGTVAEYLSKRVNSGQFDEKECHIIVDREALSIKLIVNEFDEYKRGTVVGKLEAYGKFKEFGINTDKAWSPKELARVIKMNRSFFESKEEAMKLTTVLNNFTATVNQKVEKMATEKGDTTDNFSQVVNSNLPESFFITMPIFKGSKKETFEVETVVAKIDGREVSFTLISPGANDTLEKIRDKAIDDELVKITSISKDIVIVER